ncbi:unnamed protein product [Enterobius vermicularis]|uniref:Secreted protein n=1 Tax=Enterobius vermicularis TaxID=51028 RepID=A0A0N4UVM7_ENTVE|nr:unnamed protein product [Enterobius vermicularis]
MQFFATCIWYRWRECKYQHCQYDAERGLRGAYEAGPLLVPLKDAPYLRSEGRSTVKVCCREGFFAMVVLSIESTSRLVRRYQRGRWRISRSLQRNLGELHITEETVNTSHVQLHYLSSKCFPPHDSLCPSAIHSLASRSLQAAAYVNVLLYVRRAVYFSRDRSFPSVKPA